MAFLANFGQISGNEMHPLRKSCISCPDFFQPRNSIITQIFSKQDLLTGKKHLCKKKKNLLQCMNHHNIIHCNSNSIQNSILALLSWEKEYSFCVFGKNWNYKMTLIYFEYSKSREICKTGSSGMNERHNFQYRIC